MINRGHGLVDLIAGKTPTLADWTNDPSDGGDITDGDITTFCTTGNKVAGAGWQYAYFEWDLGAFYTVLCTGVGNISVSAGGPNIYTKFWDGSAWITSTRPLQEFGSNRVFLPFGCECSKIRLGVTSDAAATITPNIREFHAWRL